jgi:SAM-dependent methyltransferase
MAPAGPCPACAGARAGNFFEERRDPIGGALYRLYRCPDCGVAFAEPRDPVGPDWYEKEAPLRAQEPRPAPDRDWRFRRFLDAGLTPGRVLDVGCGDGRFLQFAQTRGWTGVGVDYEERMIALARAKGVDAHARDFAEFFKAQPPAAFDAAVMFDVLEHAPEPRVLLAALKPALKGGAHLAITFPNDARPAWFGREDYDYPPHHFTRWTAAALRGFLEREGFTVVALDVIGPSVLWFSEMLFDRLIAPSALGAARRVLFGSRARGTLTGLYSSGAAVASSGPAPRGLKGFLADPVRRRRASGLFKYACRAVTYPVGVLLVLVCRLRGGRGEYLYALARYAA